MDLTKLTLGHKIALGCGIVLLLDLLLFNWHSVCVGNAFGADYCWTAKAMSSPGSFWGILAFLLTAVIVGVMIANKVADVELPELPIPLPAAIFYATIAVLVILFIKLISETSGLAIGAYLAILLAAGQCYGGFLIFKSEDGATSPGGGSAPPQAF